MPYQGTRKLGETCDAKQFCLPDLGCSGLFYEAAGTCIPQDQAKAQCEALDANKQSKGKWGTWGMLGMAYCNRRNPDANKPCTDNSQCVGKCIAEKEHDPPRCQEFERHFGCFFVFDGKRKTPARLCAD